MKMNRLLYTLLFFLIISSSCDILEKDESDPSPELTETGIGFLGQMPSDSIKLENGVYTSDNGITTSGSSGGTGDNGTFVSRILSIDNVSGGNRITLEVQLPYIKTDNYIVDFGGESKVAAQKILDYANQKYPFSSVKNLLSLGNKDIDKFRVGIIFQKYYKGFYSTGNQTGSYLKVVDLVEGISTDSNNKEVKTLEITFDLNIKMYYFDFDTGGPDKYVGNMKGLLKMKYIEKNSI